MSLADVAVAAAAARADGDAEGVARLLSGVASRRGPADEGDWDQRAPSRPWRSRPRRVLRETISQRI